VKKSIVLSAGSVVAASACMALFGTGVAAADDYAGQTYADASSAASDAGQTVVVAGRVGDKLPQDECLVTRSQTAPFADADDGAHYASQVQFYLNCAGAYASATNPGASVASPEGREAKAAAEQAAAEEQAALEAVSTPDE
jgi:pyruvate/2-oxoglutarate dehydrogenase complex dihydrolipoamide acyltransferase (E2) component